MGRGPGVFFSLPCTLVWTIILMVPFHCEVKTRASVELTWESWISLIRFASVFLAAQPKFSNVPLINIRRVRRTDIIQSAISITITSIAVKEKYRVLIIVPM